MRYTEKTMTSTNPTVAELLTYMPLINTCEKTADMEDMEWEYAGNVGVDVGAVPKPKDIRILMLEALASNVTQRDAANSLNMFPPTFSHWLRKLGIIAQAREIRKIKRATNLASSVA